jgi:hypothetical protein
VKSEARIEIRAARTRTRDELRVVGQAQRLGFRDVRQRLRIVRELVFGQPQESPSRAVVRRQLPGASKGDTRFPIMLQLVFAGAQIEPPLCPCRSFFDRLAVQRGGFLGTAFKRGRGAAGEVVEIGRRGDLRGHLSRAKSQNNPWQRELHAA